MFDGYLHIKGERESPEAAARGVEELGSTEPEPPERGDRPGSLWLVKIRICRDAPGVGKGTG